MRWDGGRRGHRSEGRGFRVKGAIADYLAEGAIKATAPVAITFAIGLGMQFVARHALRSMTGEDYRASR